MSRSTAKALMETIDGAVGHVGEGYKAKPATVPVEETEEVVIEAQESASMTYYFEHRRVWKGAKRKSGAHWRKLRAARRVEELTKGAHE